MRLSITTRNAEAADADCLSSLALQSKAHWGYSADFMRACEAELRVTPASINNPDFCTVVALHNDEIVGFYVLEEISADEIELGAMFVRPSCIGQGVGQQLMAHAKQNARALGAQTLRVQADPNAAKFYQAAGGIHSGSKASGSIAGRFLPIYRIRL